MEVGDANGYKMHEVDVMKEAVRKRGVTERVISAIVLKTKTCYDPHMANFRSYTTGDMCDYVRHGIDRVPPGLSLPVEVHGAGAMNASGYDSFGRDEHGLDRNTCDEHGLSVMNFRTPYGKNFEGYDENGFNADGVDKNGRTKFYRILVWSEVRTTNGKKKTVTCRRWDVVYLQLPGYAFRPQRTNESTVLQSLHNKRRMRDSVTPEMRLRAKWERMGLVDNSGPDYEVAMAVRRAGSRGCAQRDNGQAAQERKRYGAGERT